MSLHFENLTVRVNCGNLIGKLHLDLFICPGINEPCIEVEENLLTPKEFTIRAGKTKQKDWKASIRVGGLSLRFSNQKTVISCSLDDFEFRAAMEKRDVVFFDHNRQCDGKCSSRNYVNGNSGREVRERCKPPKRMKYKNLEIQESLEMDNNLWKTEEDLKLFSNVEPNNWDVDRNIEQKTNRKSRVQTREPKVRGRPRGSGKMQQIKTDSYQSTSSNVDIVPDINFIKNEEGNEDEYVLEELLSNGCTAHSEILQCLQYDPQQFWSQMQSAGVIAHFCDDIISNLINMKQIVLGSGPISKRMANVMSETVFALDGQNNALARVQMYNSNYTAGYDQMMFEFPEEKKVLAHTEQMQVGEPCRSMN